MSKSARDANQHSLTASCNNLMSAPKKIMHRVLAIPELLDTIFRSLGNKENLTNALVCRSWSEIALDALWRQVNDLHRLFNLLAPLRLSSTGQYEFSRFPESGDWKRFEKYTRRVRELVHDESKSDHQLNQTVFDDIARTRTSLAILPNMCTLNWRAPIPLCVMFMHSNVRRFAIHLPDIIETTSPRPFFDDISARMPRLTHLDIRTCIPMNALEDETVRLLSSLSNLHKFTAPRFFFTSRIAQCLSRSPKLGCIEFQYFPEQGVGDPADIVSFQPDFAEGAFPLLWDLSLTASYSDVGRFLAIPFSPSNLTMLYVESPNPESPNAIHQLLTAVSENCQMLKLLALISPRRDTSEFESSDSDSPQRVSVETLKPVFSCANLTSLEIIHHHRLDLTQDDLRALALRWPSLETLVLNTEPFDFQSSDLTLEALLPFARHCPRLTTLGLFVDASPNRIPPAHFPTSPFPPFKCLRQLSMGLSVITDPTAVAIFLSQILPPDCEIDSGITWDETFDLASEPQKTVTGRFDQWAIVKDLLPVLIKVRMEERENAKEMKREMEDLRVRTRILTEKFGTVVGPSESCVTL